MYYVKNYHELELEIERRYIQGSKSVWKKAFKIVKGGPLGLSKKYQKLKGVDIRRKRGGESFMVPKKLEKGTLLLCNGFVSHISTWFWTHPKACKYFWLKCGIQKNWNFSQCFPLKEKCPTLTFSRPQTSHWSVHFLETKTTQANSGQCKLWKRGPLAF